MITAILQEAERSADKPIMDVRAFLDREKLRCNTNRGPKGAVRRATESRCVRLQIWRSSKSFVSLGVQTGKATQRIVSCCRQLRCRQLIGLRGTIGSGEGYTFAKRVRSFCPLMHLILDTSDALQNHFVLASGGAPSPPPSPLLLPQSPQETPPPIAQTESMYRPSCFSESGETVTLSKRGE